MELFPKHWHKKWRPQPLCRMWMSWNRICNKASLRKITTDSLLHRFVWCPKRKQAGSHRETFWYVRGTWSDLQQPLKWEMLVVSILHERPQLIPNPCLIVGHHTAPPGSHLVSGWLLTLIPNMDPCWCTSFRNPTPFATFCWMLFFLPGMYYVSCYADDESQGWTLLDPRRDTFTLDMIIGEGALLGN